MNPEFARQHELFLAQARARKAYVMQQQQHQLRRHQRQHEEATALAAAAAHQQQQQQQQHAALVSAQQQQHQAAAMAELEMLHHLREEEERAKLVSLMEHQHQQQQLQQHQLLLQQEHQQRLLREQQQHRAAALMNGGGLASAAAVTSSGLDVATNSLRAEAMEQILSLQEAHHSRHPAATAAAAAQQQQQQQQQQLMRYNELEQLQELEQLRRMELMIQQQDYQQQQHFLAQYAQQQQQQQAAAPPSLRTSNLLPHNPASIDNTPVELGSSHDFVGSQHLRAQLQRRILEEEIMDARSALSNNNNNSTNHADGDKGSNGVGGVRLGSSSSNDVHRLQNILLQQELQSHQLPTYLSFGDNTSIANSTTLADPNGGFENGRDVSKMNGISSSQEAVTNVMETNTPGVFGNKSKPHDEIIISKFLTVVLTHVPEVTSQLMELIPDVMASFNSSSGVGGEKEKNGNGNSEKLTADPQPSTSVTENGNRFPTVVNITLRELKNIQHNACLAESEDLYARVTNCIVAIEPYTINSFQAAGVDGGMYQQAREVLIRSKNNNAQVGYGDMAKERADEEELPRQHSIISTLAKNSLGGSGKKSTQKQRKKRLPKRKVPDEESMSIMEMYRMDKKMKRKLVKKEMKRKEEEEAAKALLGAKEEEDEEKVEIEATGTTTTTAIRHNLLASPYKVPKDEEEVDNKAEDHTEKVEGNQQEERDDVAAKSTFEDAVSEKAEKVSLSDEEPNNEHENAALSTEQENNVLATLASASDECKASFASMSSNGASSNDFNSVTTKSDGEKKKEENDVASIFPLSSPKKIVEKPEGIGRKEDKSIRLQDGTLLFQPSAPPAFASLSSSRVVTATDAKTVKDDASNNGCCSSSTLPPGTMNGNGDADSNHGDKKNDACCDGGDCSRENGSKEDKNVKEDNDDNRADVANVLLGLMGK